MADTISVLPLHSELETAFIFIQCSLELSSGRSPVILAGCSYPSDSLSDHGLSRSSEVAGIRVGSAIAGNHTTPRSV